MFETLPFQLLLSALVGAAIGLQRESNTQGDYPGSAGGIRTYALVSLLGGLAGFFYNERVSALFIGLCAFIGLLVLIYYVVGSTITKHAGITNELSVIFTFLIGFLITTQILAIQITVALLVVLLVILALKSKTQRLMLGISGEEITSFISYAIIALVILPFLPNVPVFIQDVPVISTMLESYNVQLGRFAEVELFNPRKIWLIVVLVTGIDVFGYVLGKLFGHKKSFTLTSFVGGFISSTSTTLSLAHKSARTGIVNSLVGAAIVANMASFFQLFLLVGPINSKWLVSITPTLILIIVTCLIAAGYFLKKEDPKRSKSKDGVDEEDAGKKNRIFALMPAIKFALLLIAVKLVTKVCLVFFGQSGFIISSIIASFAGIDAIVLNLADMAGGAITFETALLTFVLVNATNLLSKTVYAFTQGNKQFGIRFMIASACIVAASFVGFLF